MTVSGAFGVTGGTNLGACVGAGVGAGVIFTGGMVVAGFIVGAGVDAGATVMAGFTLGAGVEAGVTGTVFTGDTGTKEFTKGFSTVGILTDSLWTNSLATGGGVGTPVFCPCGEAPLAAP